MRTHLAGRHKGRLPDIMSESVVKDEGVPHEDDVEADEAAPGAFQSGGAVKRGVPPPPGLEEPE